MVISEGRVTYAGEHRIQDGLFRFSLSLSLSPRSFPQLSVSLSLKPAKYRCVQNPGKMGASIRTSDALRNVIRGLLQLYEVILMPELCFTLFNVK